MDYIFISTQIGFIIITIVFYGLFLRVFRAALHKTEFSENKQRYIFNRTVVGLSAWAVIISILSLAGITSDFTLFPPKFAIVGVVPLTVLVWVLLFSKTTKAILDHIPQVQLFNLQVFRVFVEILLWMLFIDNVLPIQMTFEGTNFDILAGITGPIVAYLGFVKSKWPKSVLVVWNLICLGLLFNIVATAMLSLPTPFRYFMNEPASIAVTTFPIIWLPGLLVPLAYGLHFLSLRQLLSK